MTAARARILAAAALLVLAGLAALSWLMSLISKLRLQGIISGPPPVMPSPADVSGLLAEAARITRDAAQ